MNAQEYYDLLQKDGYIKIKSVFPLEKVEELKKEVLTHAAAPGNNLEDVPYLNRGHDVVYNLQNKDAAFVHLFTRNELIKNILHMALNDIWYKQIPANEGNYLLRSLMARSSGPGLLPLHIDSFIPNQGDFIWTVQAIVVVDPQRKENGCSLVIPGSHKFGRYADQGALNTGIPVESDPGDVTIWDSRLWHGALGNESGKSRWAIIATFCRWWLKQHFDIPRSLPQAIYSKMTNEEKAILGFCSMPPLDEQDRLDMKCGYDFLKSNVSEYFQKKK